MSTDDTPPRVWLADGLLFVERSHLNYDRSSYDVVQVKPHVYAGGIEASLPADAVELRPVPAPPVAHEAPCDCGCRGVNAVPDTGQARGLRVIHPRERDDMAAALHSAECDCGDRPHHERETGADYNQLATAAIKHARIASGDTVQAPNPLDGADDLPPAVRIQLKDRRDVVAVLREYGHTADEQHVAASVRAALRGPAARAATPEGPRVQVTAYVVSCVPEDIDSADAWDIGVEYRGRNRWAVTRRRRCLGVDGEWEYESIPSEREDEWLAAHRFDLETALRLAREQAPMVSVNGYTPSAARSLTTEETP